MKCSAFDRRFHPVSPMAARSTLWTCSFRRSERLTSFRRFSAALGAHGDFPFLLSDFPAFGACPDPGGASLRLVFLALFPGSGNAANPRGDGWHLGQK